MNIIEQAAKRLEELRRAGVDIPWAAAGTNEAEVLATPHAAVAHAAAQQAAVAPVVAPGVASAPAPATPLRVVSSEPVAAAPVAVPARPARDRRSKEVQLDMDLLFRQGYLVRETSQSLLADQLRIIKRPLLRNVHPEGGAATLRRPNLVLVTSALPGEGKTFFAVNLAMSIAMEVDHSVLLVDADVVRPAVLQRCGVQPTQGLMDVLCNPSLDLADVMLRTNVPKLSILPAGTAMKQSSEMLASTAMDRLLDELAQKYSDRIVIFDAPPLLPTTESRVLAGRMGQVLMVVEANRTEQSRVAQAYAALEHCPVVMSVLNKTSASKATAGYGYGYG
ncbi:MAG TPA: XrtA-associated tyrosine autokinase, partial [Burkholderiaceae bacterium]|nr:XrtA-associated tyrosine autokinase [Burkholderiaceae bacterium]